MPTAPTSPSQRAQITVVKGLRGPHSETALNLQKGVVLMGYLVETGDALYFESDKLVSYDGGKTRRLLFAGNRKRIAGLPLGKFEVNLHKGDPTKLVRVEVLTGRALSADRAVTQSIKGYAPFDD
jgi:hypothetical protein